MSKETGGSAFPDFKQNGMTLRDYFAAKALQGMMADSTIAIEPHKDLAVLSYRMADAMLAERAQ